MTYQLEADFELKSDWLPREVFAARFDSLLAAIATALDGAPEGGDGEVRVICVETGEIVWRSSDLEYA